MFSIIIPTWNNLDYLKLCIAAVREHSHYRHEIIVHVNEDTDGTCDWLRSEGIAHSRSERNLGVCLSANLLAARATRDWLLYLNDDMVCCPGWDVALIAAAKAAPSDLAMFFSTLIEPTDSKNPLVIVRDFGRSPAEFDARALVRDHAAEPREDVLGRASQPTLVHRAWWHAAGGYSIEFSPGMCSDDDLLVKFWAMGCRHFRVVGASRVYHFGCRSTGRVRKNEGARTFVMKWGLTHRQFKRLYLEGGGGDLTTTTKGRMKRLGYAFADSPLADLARWEAAPARDVSLGIDGSGKPEAS